MLQIALFLHRSVQPQGILPSRPPFLPPYLIRGAAHVIGLLGMLEITLFPRRLVEPQGSPSLLIVPRTTTIAAVGRDLQRGGGREGGREWSQLSLYAEGGPSLFVVPRTTTIAAVGQALKEGREGEREKICFPSRMCA